ncbi:alpha/beta fold hydrolase [Paenibacillus glycanilyticus]|uniref:alpha/beta fold hydrolase n=1 Tax=Paenibacillus glycanilyticus TaxID=126569 RepID=UPI00203E8057|nr:alpha/beta fold hydrolase [Paenibacillus glycanilyticus]MCM3626146.1 alpha/beta fold hydrolase [Paenibacillus glycanilyticus]
MSTYILIHGAWHGAWCWEKIVPVLESNGHRVIAIDLPGHGEDQTPVLDVTLDLYTDRVVAVIDELDEEVILVGHSMGGIVVSQAAEYRPNRIKWIVYLTAFLLQNGQNMIIIPPNPNMQVSEDRRTITVPAEKAKDTFYNNCLDEDAVRAAVRLRVQSLSPFVTPLNLTEQNFGRVPRYYIEGLRDQAIPIDRQRQMHAASPCKKVFSLDTDHSPFYSMPEQLSNILLNID